MGSIEGMNSTQLFALWLDQAAIVLLGVGADECILIRALYIVNVFFGEASHIHILASI